ncbi:MAG: amidase [Burkholderiaceae bacterium]
MARNADPGAVPMHAQAPRAWALAQRLAGGSLRAEELAQAYLEQIERREGEVRAWAWLDADHVLTQARECDRRREAGLPLGPLHGLPVGVKDIIDTADIPTENGTILHRARTPAKDAALVTRLKAAGAVIMGKTVTAELAFLQPGKTCNPLDPAHTPGGSSSGSAAAVAAGMVPLAIGTQTGGSVIRPAAYCGVVGFKPTFGAIARTGVLSQSPSLDTVGVFAHHVADAALLADSLFGFDAGDPATRARPFPRLLETVNAGAPVQPMFAMVRTPFWHEADEAMQAAFTELAGFLGDQCFEVELPDVFRQAPVIREQINFAEMAMAFRHLRQRSDGQLSEHVMAAMTAGDQISAPDYLAALEWPARLNSGLEEILQRCDAIITPAAHGPAPRPAKHGKLAVRRNLDPLRQSGGDPARLRSRQRPAHGSATGWPAGLRRPTVAHRRITDADTGAGPRRR